MKYLVNFIFFTSCFIYGQETTHRVLSAIDSTEVEDAFILIDDEVITFTDSFGRFKIKNYQEFKILDISHLKYKTLKISFENFKDLKTIYLEEQLEELSEVIVQNKKYKTKKILPSQSFFSKLGYYKGHKTNFNSIYATYLPNKKYKNSETIIKNILIETHAGYWGNPHNEFMPFKVNLYSVDSVTKLPKDKILPDKFLAAKKINGKKFVVVNVEDYFLEFSSEGIFVAVETFTKEEYINLQGLSYETPAFKIIRKRSKPTNVTFSRWFDKEGNIKKDWIDDKIPELDFIFNFGLELELLN